MKTSNLNAARFISFWTGFCSLSLEIAWVRLYGYANQSTPQAFGFVLAVYLLGIALGAQWGKRICRLHSRAEIENRSIWILMGCAGTALAAPWFYLESVSVGLDDLVVPLAIGLTAASLSVLFPITHHLGTPEAVCGVESNKGRHFSRVYLLNVLGAALGPLVTGYVLLDLFSLAQVFSVLGAAIVLTAFGAAWLFGRRPQLLLVSGFCVSVLVLLVSVLSSAQDPHVFARRFASFAPENMFSVLENRHGIIGIERESVQMPGKAPFQDFSVYGGNVYDGKVNLDLERNTNALQRPIALHVLQPQARRVLVLGLSIGSWLAVVEGFPGVEHIDVVEINPGYLEMAQAFPAQARALRDPRVHLHVDDARRWLQYHPQERYDLVLMNTTWHWRSNSSMLLSKEMMQIIQRHLAPKGVVTFNATGSLDAFYTAAQVFSEVRRYENFIYGADWDCFEPAASPDAWQVLWKLRVDGRPAFGPQTGQITKFAKIPFLPLEADLAKSKRSPEVITDDNMLVEYRRGRWR